MLFVYQFFSFLQILIIYLNLHWCDKTGIFRIHRTVLLLSFCCCKVIWKKFNRYKNGLHVLVCNPLIYSEMRF